MYRKRKYRLSRKSRSRTRSRVYMRRRMRRLRYKTRPEMKTTAVQAAAQSLPIAATTIVSSTLWASQNFLADMLSNISQGTNYSNRIGNTIFVKGIRMRTLAYGCAGAANINIGNFLWRIIIWTGENTVATNVATFFNASTLVNFHSPINRKLVRQVLYDRVHLVQSNGYINTNSTEDATCGAVAMKNIWIPLNRRITYTVGGAIKDDENKINVAMLVATPGMSSTYDGRQIACCHSVWQMFFTDN